MTIINLEGDYAKARIKTPFRMAWDDPRMAYWLHVTVEDDNLKSSATYHWVLFSEDMVSLQTGDVEIKGEDYLTKDNDNIFPFTYVANEKGIEII